MSGPLPLLDLCNDAVFKIFFSKEQNRSLLISLLETVIEPKLPIQSVEILNPSLPKVLPEEKLSVLDLMIRLADGSRIDVEMQVNRSDGFRGRILYYWAKLHQDQLTRGDRYGKLSPTLSIAILDYIEFKEALDEIHSIFELRERTRGNLYLPDMQLHFLELPKYAAWKKKTGERHRLLDYWTRFFKATELTEQDRKELTQEPIMGKALKALEELSQDPEARELAEAREKHRINLHIIRTEAEAKGKAEGLAEGEAKGKAKGLAEGEAKGKAEGLAEANQLRVKQAAKAGLTPEAIATMFELELTEVLRILQEAVARK